MNLYKNFCEELGYEEELEEEVHANDYNLRSKGQPTTSNYVEITPPPKNTNVIVVAPPPPQK